MNNLVNIDDFSKYKGNVMGLARIVEMELGKKFSKYNQQSCWVQRPLRKGQLHYGALDAVVCVVIIKKMREKYKVKEVEIVI